MGCQGPLDQDTYVTDPFAERLITLSREMAAAVRSELGLAGQEPHNARR